MFFLHYSNYKNLWNSNIYFRDMGIRLNLTHMGHANLFSARILASQLSICRLFHKNKPNVAWNSNYGNSLKNLDIHKIDDQLFANWMKILR